MDTIIRPACNSDLAGIYRIVLNAHSNSYYEQLVPRQNWSAFQAHYTWSKQREQLFCSRMNARIDSEHWRIYVAERKNKVVGYVSAYVENSKMTLKSLFVDPAQHGEGIGERLLLESFKWCQPGVEIHLTVIAANQVAKRLYTKHDFKHLAFDERRYYGAEQEVLKRMNY